MTFSGRLSIGAARDGSSFYDFTDADKKNRGYPTSRQCQVHVSNDDEALRPIGQSQRRLVERRR